MFSVSTAPFLWTGLPAPTLHQVLPRCVLLLPPDPLGGCVAASPQALTPGCQHTCIPKNLALPNPHSPRPLLFLVFQCLCAHRNTAGTSYSPAILQAASKDLGHSNSSCTPSPTKSLLEMQQAWIQISLLPPSPTTAQSRVQVSWLLNCSIQFLFNPQNIISNQQHLFSILVVRPLFFVFCRNRNVKCSINELKIREYAYSLPYMQENFCLVPRVCSIGCAWALLQTYLLLQQEAHMGRST